MSGPVAKLDVLPVVAKLDVLSTDLVFLEIDISTLMSGHILLV